MTPIACLHPAASRWEVNPVTRVYTRRCVRCGAVLEFATDAEIAASKETR